MADARGLRMIGILYGVIAIIITVIAYLVVSDHVMGRLSLDNGKGSARGISATMH